MKNIFKIILCLTSLQMAVSCAALNKLKAPKELPPINSLDGAKRMNVKDFFNGRIEASAIKQDEDGKIIGSFTAKINGKWDENKGTVQYDYVYNTGNKDSRTWLVSLDNDTNFSAIGHDFVEPAIGRQSGNVAQTLYSLNIPYQNIKQRMDFEDNIYLVDDNSAIAISVMRQDGDFVEKSIIALKKVNSN